MRCGQSRTGEPDTSRTAPPYAHCSQPDSRSQRRVRNAASRAVLVKMWMCHEQSCLEDAPRTVSGCRLPRQSQLGNHRTQRQIRCSVTSDCCLRSSNDGALLHAAAKGAGLARSAGGRGCAPSLMSGVNVRGSEARCSRVRKWHLSCLKPGASHLRPTCCPGDSVRNPANWMPKYWPQHPPGVLRESSTPHPSSSRHSRRVAVSTGETLRAYLSQRLRYLSLGSCEHSRPV